MAPIRKRRTADASGDVEKTEKVQSESEVQPDSYESAESASGETEEKIPDEAPAEDDGGKSRPVRTVKTRRRAVIKVDKAAEEEANEDYDYKLSVIDDLVGSGTLTVGELAETIKTQQFELTQLKKENILLKSKLVQAAAQGFKV